MYQLVWNYVRARLREPSTWRGFVAAVTASGVAIAPQWQEFIVGTGIAFFTALSSLPDTIPAEPVKLP